MIDVCIVGGGFSSVPLARELARTGIDFRIVSDGGDTVWDRLASAGRLDFDLVSSAQSSFYSFDLADTYREEFYPTAGQFHAMQRRWRGHFRRWTLRDRVVSVDNFEDHSVLRLEAGGSLRARHLVFCTGFKRAVMSDLAGIDYSAANRTFLFDTMGDSANLMISKLVPNGNRVIVRTGGFFPIDKAVFRPRGMLPAMLAVDQLEFHNFRYASAETYGSIIYGGPHRDGCNPVLLHDRFPAAARRDAGGTARSRPPNGRVIVKYWPVDQYARRFGGNLDAAVAGGYLLNDIAMWLHTGRVVLAPKDAPVDFGRRTIRCAGADRRFDHYVAGGPEEPQLPPVRVGGTTPWRHRHRDAFLGVVPRGLSNTYLVGYTRPTSGGLANITEMQGLLVHKLVTRPAFRRRVAARLDRRLAAYDAHYYGAAAPRGRYDHLVHYGFYTDDIARLIGVDHKVGDCRTLRDLIFYYAFPNDAFKYRAAGEYSVPGVADLIGRVGRHYQDFVMMFAYLAAGSLVAPGDRPAWLRSGRRALINDMRPKAGHRAFLDRYIEAYRRVTGARVEAQRDDEWDGMALRAGAHNRRAAGTTVRPDAYRMDDDMNAELGRFGALLDTPLDALLSGAAGGLDAPRRRLLALLRDPPEYRMDYLDG